MMLSVWQGGDAFPSCLCHRSQRSLYFPFFASTSIHTLAPARKRAAMPWYVSALCEMNGGSVSLHLLTGGGRGCRRGGMRQTEIYIYLLTNILQKSMSGKP